MSISPDLKLEGVGACFLSGTRIAAPVGSVTVEDLSVGAMVLTVTGESRPVRWVGHRGIDCRRRRDPSEVWPFRIRAGAFADGKPARDLWLSRGHSVFIEGVLIQIEQLANGATIAQDPCAHVEYWHVELDSHDILLAEGLPAESYLDVGNRSFFENGGTLVEAFPDFQPKGGADTCVPLVKEGAVLERARAALIARAAAMGYARTDDADLHIVADKQRIEPARLGDQRMAFLLPPGIATIELRCRCFIPAGVDPTSNDTRSLGVCVRRLQLNDADVLEDDTALAEGWHSLEGTARDGFYRWSKDHVRLPAGTRLVVLDLCFQGTHYWLEPAGRVESAVAVAHAS